MTLGKPLRTPLYLRGMRLFVAWAMGLLGSLAVVTHLSQLMGLSFRSYAWISATIPVAGTLITCGALWRHRYSPDSPSEDQWASWFARVLIAGAALLALCSFRPYADDYYYVPSAVHALQNPAEPLGFQIHGLIPPDDVPLISYNYATSLAFEYLSAVLAYCLNTEYLAVYYFVMPMIVAATMAAALIFLVGQLRLKPLATVLGCLIALALWLLMGETHRSFGNFTVTRAFQGKTLLLGAGVPIFAAATLEFFRKPNGRSWWLVAATTVAMLGASASAMVLLPLLAIVLVIAVVAASSDWKKLIPRIAIYGAAFSYLLAYTLVYLASGYAKALGPQSPINAWFPSDFYGQLWLVVNREMPIWPFIALSGLVIYFRYAPRRARVFAAAWIAGCLILYLNPLIAPWLIEHVTSPNLYWRLFYLLPVVPLLASAAGLLLDRLNYNSQRVVAAALAMVLAVAAHGVIPQASVFHRAELGLPRYSLPPAELVEARTLLAANIPPGPMLAPLEIGAIVPLLSAGYPQVLRHNYVERIWLDGPDCAFPVMASRFAAVQFTEGKNQDVDHFLQVVRTLSPTSLVFKPEGWNYLQETGLSRRLAELGYENPAQLGNLFLLGRRG